MSKFRINYLFLGLVVFASFACGDDEENGPSYEFKDQTAQGQVEGNNWTFVSGLSEVSFFDEANISFELTSETYEDPCAEFILDGVRVLFDAPAEVGIYELSFSENGHTVTLYNPETQLNSIAVDGAIEIVSITETEVTGRIDAHADSETFVNGDFTVPFCAEE